MERGKKHDKPFLSGNEVWCNQHNAMVVVGQPASQWAVLEGRP